MRFLVDTNILLHAVNRNAPEHEAALESLRGAAEGSEPWCLAWVNIYEFLRVSTHPRVFPAPLKWTEAMGNIRSIIENPLVEILSETSRHLEILEEVADLAGGVQGNFWHDCHIAALMLEHDVKVILTGDMDFRKFPFLRVENPFRS